MVLSARSTAPGGKVISCVVVWLVFLSVTET